MNDPTIGALCAGYGGLDQAVQQVLGGTVSWVSEFEAAPASILAHHYPHAPNLGDLTRIDWAQVEPVDILTAGFPCQPVSHAGGRKGINDKRWLFDDITRALRVMDPPPRLCVFENVLGLLSANSGHAMARVIEGLASVGYVGTYRVLAASDVGAPHRRKRVFIVAWPADADSPGPQGAQPAGIVRGPDAPERGGADVTLLPTPAVNDMGAGKTVEDWDAWTARMQAEHGNGNGHGKSLHIEAARLLPTPVTSYSARTAEDWRAGRPAGNGGTREQIGDLRIVAEETDFGVYAPAIARWEALTRPAPAPTEPTGRNGAHRLSPKFVEWMQGLPDGWVTDVPGITRNQALKALGNGVVPQQAAAALAHLLTDQEQP